MTTTEKQSTPKKSRGSQQSQGRSQSNGPSKGRDQGRGSQTGPTKLLLLLSLAALIAIAYWNFGSPETLSWLVTQEQSLRSFQADRPITTFAIAFVCYAAITGLSLPGAAIMTLFMGWYFGWLRSVVLVSFASTLGATIAFLLSRYFFRDLIQSRFEKQLTRFNQAIDREGAFYLFTLRLIPTVPFFVINAVMGLTKLPVVTYWWVSQLGMLAATIVYCYAGSQIPDLKTLTEEGVGAVFTSSQLIQLTVALVLLGCFPLAAKKLLTWLKPATALNQNTEEPR